MSFQAFGIKHLSPSSVAKWNGERGAWVAHYIFKLRDDFGPAMWRGKAVEAGLERSLHRPSDDALDHAMQQFENDAQGLADDATDKERENIEPMLEQAIAAMPKLGCGPLVASQVKSEGWLDGVGVPLVGYPDFIFDGFCLDLKTTLRCPSEIRPDHALQIAFYAHTRGEKRADILYVTPKKSAHFVMTKLEISEAIETLRKRARSIETTLYAADAAAHHSGRQPEDVLAEMCAPDFSSFYWSDALRQQAVSVPAWA